MPRQGFAISRHGWASHGSARLAGFAAAMAAELPNSFLKRRVGIPPGAQANGMRGMAFHVLDQVDVGAGL